MNETGSAARAAKAPFRHVNMATPAVDVERRPDGVLILRSPRPLGSYRRNIVEYLRHWSEAAPDRVMLAERDASGEWRRLTYAEVRAHVDRIAASLMARGLGPGRPAMILSGNSIAHAELALACMSVGVPVAPLSVAYSLASQDLVKLRHCFDLVRPALVLVQSGRLFRRALAALDLAGVELVAVNEPPEGIPATSFASLLEGVPGADLEERFASLGPDTVAKILFTSGSTGMPKGVINTQRMLCANQRMAEIYAIPDPDNPPVLLDWLPWNHTMGGNFHFNACMRQGGTYHIDGGRPLPGQFEQTIANLREIAPTQLSNVPAGYAMLAPRLEQDEALRRNFFSRLKLLGYGGASLPQELWQRFQDLAVRTVGERIMFVTGWGSTETAPTATSLHWPVEGSGVIGLPYPGVEIKMIPRGDRYELRVRGPIVTPGYLGRPDLTEAAFDEEGFYRIGDAGRFVDAADPAKGLAFAGRVVEDFKLDSGTWVQVGRLRLAAIDAAAPLLQDAVVTGHDRSFVGLLAWPNLDAARGICDDPADAAMPERLVKNRAVVAHLRAGLRRHNESHGGSSMRIARVILMSEPPSIDGNEITDKGYVNQGATLTRRRNLVEQLHAEPPGPDVIVI
ncbi:MAG: AMP-binding protein [Alphaproteobacteria bacterium]|nr:AMP-binding protein [Alphaproteobacteria bacterium]